MPLDEYYKLRDFSKSPEPGGKAEKSGTGKSKIFSVQEHDASHLHWDFRLEIGGVLKSWAIPKQPPLEEGIKRLAIQTEDHPIEYATFEGVIPEGLYGAGTVKLWDHGEYNEIEIKDNKIIVELSGSRMKGTYVLVKTRFRGQENSWLFFKKKKE